MRPQITAAIAVPRVWSRDGPDIVGFVAVDFVRAELLPFLRDDIFAEAERQFG
jgi:hypothetical protein